MIEPTAARRNPVLSGALLLACIGAPATVTLAGAAIAQERASFGAGALALLGGLLVAGGIGGWAFGATTPLRGRGWLAHAASWWLATVAVIAVLLAAVHLIVPRIGLDPEDSLLLGHLVRPRALALLVLAALLFGMMMAESASTDERMPVIVGLSDEIPRGTLLRWGALLLVGWATVGILGGRPSLPLPDDAFAARRVIADAEAAARNRPGDAHAQLAYGVSLMRLERFDEALPVLERAAALDPSDSYPRNLLGWILNRQLRFAEAVPHLQEAVRIDPEYAEAQHNLGWAMLRLDRVAEAEEALARAVELSPNEASVAGDYAWALFRRSKAKEAIAQMLRATKLDSTNFRYHGSAGFLLHTQARFAEAQTHLERAVLLRPDNGELWTQLGMTSYLLGDLQRARESFEKAARFDGTLVAMGTAAHAMWQAAKRGDAGTSRTVGATTTVIIREKAGEPE